MVFQVGVGGQGKFIGLDRSFIVSPLFASHFLTILLYPLENTVFLLIKKCSLLHSNPLFYPSLHRQNNFHFLHLLSPFWDGIISLTLIMSFQKRQRERLAIQAIERLIGGNEEVRMYFEKNCERRNYCAFALELMKDAVNLRMERNKSKEKHYHVAYVKHNRFLSPSQKAEVTDKVTQIIPMPDKINKIFVKPKPKNAEPTKQIMNSDRQIIGKQENHEKYLQEIPQQKPEKRQNAIDQAIQTQQPQRQQQYLYPKGPLKVSKPTVNNIKPTPQRKQSIINQNTQFKADYFSPKSSHSNNQLNIQSKYRSNSKDSMKLSIVSPRRKENYDQIESKIKGLIDRDKNSRKMGQLMTAQSKRIDQLEERQEKLLLMQYQRQKQMGKPLKSNNLINYGSSSSDSQSLQLKYDSNRLSSLAFKIDAIDQRVQSVRDNHKTLYSALQKLKDKTYKMNSHPNYAISSSSSQQSDYGEDG